MALVDRRAQLRRDGADESDISAVTSDLQRECRRAKRAFLKSAITEEDWRGIRLVKTYQPAQTRIQNANGHIVASSQRSQVFAEYYRDLQFARANLPPLPDRAALFSVAPLTEADFSAEELRRVQKKVKKKRAGGSDTLSVEFVLALLSIPEGFTSILSLFNQCWRTETIPELWQLGRISAI